jgi:hypothetical protein
MKMPWVWWATLVLSALLTLWVARENLALAFVLGAGIGTNRLLQLCLVARGERWR